MSEIKTGQPPPTLPISVGAVTEIGQREENQDSMTGFSSPFGAVYLIADGMGGHRGGAAASSMVAEAFSRHLLAAPASTPPRDAVTLAVRLANVEILEKGKSGDPEFEGMGSTVVIALVRQITQGLELTTAHIGDSRIYLQRDGKLSLLTKDHTQVQWLIDTHAIDEAGARNHPDSSVLTRAMGHTTDLQVDISDPIPLLDGDGILLCSDGLSGFASAEDIDRTIQQNPDPSKCAAELVQLALASGSNDNITVQFLRIGNGAQAPPRERNRKTQPEGKTLPAATLGVKPGSRRRLMMATLVVVISSVLVWLYFHHPPAPVVDPKIQKLDEDILTLSKGADSVNTTAKTEKAQVTDDIAKLNAKTSTADKAKPAALLADFKMLDHEIDKVIENSAILKSSVEKDYAPTLKSIKPELPDSEKKKTLDPLSQRVAGGQNSLKTQQDALSNCQKCKSELEADTGPAKAGTQTNSSKTPPAHPACALLKGEHK